MTTPESAGSPPAADPIAEIRSTRETAEKIAMEGATEGTDVARLLGGLIAHLAEQVEKLISGSLVGKASAGKQQDGEGSATQITDAAQEEDVAPDSPQLRRETRTRVRASPMSVVKSLWASIQGDPKLMRALNGWLTIFWIVMIPVSIFTGWISSVTYVAALSLWAFVRAIGRRGRLRGSRWNRRSSR